MKRGRNITSATLRPLILAAAVSASLVGCIQTRQQKTWPRVAAEKSFEILKNETNDVRRGEIRDYVKALIALEKGGDPDRRYAHGNTLLMMAVIRQDKEIVSRLLSLDVYADVNCTDENGDTPLIVACKLGEVDIVKMLIEAGAQINLQNKDGMTALMACARCGSKPIAGALMSAGANIHLQDARGDKVGDYAKSSGHADMIPFAASFHSEKGEVQ